MLLDGTCGWGFFFVVAVLLSKKISQLRVHIRFPFPGSEKMLSDRKRAWCRSKSDFHLAPCAMLTLWVFPQQENMLISLCLF